MKTLALLFKQALIVCLLLGCDSFEDSSNSANRQTSSSELNIDKRSYNLGVIGAFAEVVDIGIKKLALSAAMTPEEMDALIADAQRIVKDNHVECYLETDFLVTDLFPAEVTEGKHVLLIYKGSIKQEYLALKSKKKQFEQLGEYNSAVREAIARSMGELLSYPAERIKSLLDAN